MTPREKLIAENLTMLKALNQIAGLMDAKSWSPDTLDAIADVLREAGFTVRDLADEGEQS